MAKKFFQVGCIRRSQDGKFIIVEMEGGQGGIALTPEVSSVIAGTLVQVPIKARSWLGVDLGELLEFIKKKKSLSGKAEGASTAQTPILCQKEKT